MIESKARISSKNLQCLGRGPSFPERELAGGLNGLRLGERKADNALDLQRGKKDAPDLKFALEKPRFRIGLPSMNGAIVSTGSNHSSAAEVDGAKLPAASFGSANTSEAAVLGTRQTPTLPDVGTLESSLRSMLNLSQPGASTPLDHQRRPTPNSPLGSSQLLWPGRAPTLNSLPIPSFLSKANPPWVAGEGSSDPPVSLPKGGFNSSVPSSAKPYSPISTSLVPGVICPLCYNKEYWYFPSESEFRRHVAQLHPSEDVQDLLRRLPPPSQLLPRLYGIGAGHGTPIFPGQGPDNDRPFKCDQCPQSFNRNHDLKRHKRIHLAVKPFPCIYCDKSFSRKDALKRHRLVKGCGKVANNAESKPEKTGYLPKVGRGEKDQLENERGYPVSPSSPVSRRSTARSKRSGNGRRSCMHMHYTISQDNTIEGATRNREKFIAVKDRQRVLPAKGQSTQNVPVHLRTSLERDPSRALPDSSQSSRVSKATLLSYETELMLLEQQNKKRLLAARKEVA